MTSKSTTKTLLAGGIAGAVEATINYPTEFVKTQLQLYPGTYTGPINCGMTIIKEKGFFSIYRGLSTVVVGSIPKAAVRFASFGFFKTQLEDDKGKLTATKSMLAGLGAGVVEALVAVTPMETVKTAFIHDSNQPVQKYKGLVHGCGVIFKEEGLGGFYKGTFATMLKQGGNQAVRFTAYNNIKDALLRGEKRTMAAWESVAAGGLAGTISVYATMPFDVLKTKLQGLNSKEYTSSLDCLVKVVKKDGVTGLWKGTTPRLARVFVSSSIIFTVVEQVIKFVEPFWPEPVETKKK
jgi:solute carrier family 25 citrate transporter 1